MRPLNMQCLSGCPQADHRWCDKCGEEEATHTYRDTIFGTDTEVAVIVCGQCMADIQEMQCGKEYQVYFRRIDWTSDLPFGA